MKPKFIILLSLIIFILVFLNSGCSGRKQQTNKPGESSAIPVKIITLSAQELPLLETIPGTVISKTQSIVSPRIMGTIQSIYIIEGDRVKAGQRLAQLDTKTLQPEIEKTNAREQEINNGLAELDKAKEELVANRTAALANYDFTSTAQHRSQNLYNRDAISREMLDESIRQNKIAEANIAVITAKSQGLEEKRKQLYDKQKQIAAELTLAKVNLGYATIYSPISGMVTKKVLDIGSMAAPGQPMFLIETPEYQFQTAVKDAVVPKLHLNQKVVVKIDSIPNDIEGAIQEINPVTDSLSRTGIVKISLPNPVNLRSGLYGTAGFSIGTASRMMVPKTAIIEKGSLQGVYTVDSDNITRYRLIKSGNIYGELVEITGGLQIGDRIIISELERIQDGMKVEVTP
jgi:RND family efflux transporter MFP subunit